jgi:general secretion pathway protein F
MPIFAYETLDTEGKTRRGVLEADTLRLARSALRNQGLIPVAVSPAEQATAPSPSRWNRSLWTPRVFKGTALAVWTRQLAGLVAAGLTLERALAALADESEHIAQSQLIAGLRAEVNAGASLAAALQQHPREFDDSYVAVIAAGEQGGELSLVLERLAEDLEERDSLRHKLLSAALYPMIVTGFALVIVIFLMTYVVPQVASAFSSGNRALPTLTVVMLSISGALRGWGLWLLPLIAAIVMAFAWARRQPTQRLRIDAAWLRLPLLGRLALGYNGARFAATLSMLAGAGVPILKALQTAAQTLNNRALRADALEALNMVREGAPIASALATRKRFPALLITFARLGEQTGQLPDMLQRAAEQMSADVQRRALRLATSLEPLLIVAMGVVVLLIVLSVMLPIIQLNQLVK